MDRQAHVICISRAPGAGGEQVGRIVSTELGYGYVDEQIVARAAQKLGVSPDLVASAEERTPLAKRMLREIVSDMANVSMMSGVAPPHEPGPSSDDYRDLIQEAIHETAKEGNVVIVAHAASIALAGRTDMLRVLVTGTPEVRADRLAGEQGLVAGEAKKLVREGDKARADYLRRFYGLKEELPTHYDLVVNTDVLTPEDAAVLVLSACGR